MGFTSSQLSDAIIICKKGLASIETTYFVDDTAYCLSHLTNGSPEFCMKIAGWGTTHLGTGSCKKHRGALKVPRIKNGRYADVTKRNIRKYYEKFENDPEMMSLASELAMLRAFLAEAITQYQSQGSMRNMKMIFEAINSITRTVETIERMQQSQVLTVARSKLIMTIAMGVVEQFVPPERLAQFVDVWKQEVLGTMAIEVEEEPALVLESRNFERNDY